MKLAFVFLVCFVAVSLQQNVYWRSRAAAPSPYYHGIPSSYAYQPEYPAYPGYYSGYPEYSRYPVFHAFPGYPYYPSQYHEMPYYSSGQQYPAVESSADVYPAVGAEEQYGSQNVDTRFFGLGLFNNNNLLNNILRRTTTVYTTTTSTVSANTVVTCYTRTMFASTTACRRKRSFPDTITVGDNEAPHTQHETLSVGELPREGRDYEAADLIESSKQDSVSGMSYSNPSEAAIKDFMGRQLLRSTVTSTVTSFSLSYSTSTATNTKLGAAAGLTCLPAGFTLC